MINLESQSDAMNGESINSSSIQRCSSQGIFLILTGGCTNQSIQKSRIELKLYHGALQQKKMKARIWPSGKLLCLLKYKTIETVHQGQLGRYEPSPPSTKELHDLVIKWQAQNIVFHRLSGYKMVKMRTSLSAPKFSSNFCQN